MSTFSAITVPREPDTATLKAVLNAVENIHQNAFLCKVCQEMIGTFL